MSQPNDRADGVLTAVDGGAGRFRIDGALSFAAVPGILAASEVAFAEQAALTVDLAGVTQADSAGLALLLLWVQRARARTHALVFLHPPASLLGIAKLAEVEDMLAAAAPGAPG
jgi:phospholipid transport system transporter-binding protein